MVEPYAGSELRAPTGRGPVAGCSTPGFAGAVSPLEPAEWLLVTRGRRLLGRHRPKSARPAYAGGAGVPPASVVPCPTEPARGPIGPGPGKTG